MPPANAFMAPMKRVNTPDGTAIGVDEAGGGGRVPILFLHGVGSDKSVWAPQLEHFGAARRAVALDYPGYGNSDPAPAGGTRDDFAAAILAAMDSLGIDRAHVCGLSLGGVIAIAMHHAAPERCASLILADSFAVHPDGQAIYDRSIAASEQMSELAAARTPVLLAPGASEELHQQVRETMAAIDPEAFRIGAEAVWLADQRERAAAIRVPTLVLVGDQDMITPPELSQALADLIPGAVYREISGDAFGIMYALDIDELADDKGERGSAGIRCRAWTRCLRSTSTGTVRRWRIRSLVRERLMLCSSPKSSSISTSHGRTQTSTTTSSTVLHIRGPSTFSDGESVFPTKSATPRHLSNRLTTSSP